MYYGAIAYDFYPRYLIVTFLSPYFTVTANVTLHIIFILIKDFFMFYLLYLLYIGVT